MSDVLTKEELNHLDGMFFATSSKTLTIIDRLVAEVERLRKTDLQWPHIVTPCVCCESMRASLKEALK